MKTIKVLLGNRIREIRKMKGLTQEQLAELVNIEQKHVSRIELGKSAPTFERLELFSQILNVPIADFFHYDHFEDQKTRAKSFDEMMKELSEENQKLAYRIFSGIIQALKENQSQ
jgi:transcriptional regulator with XRE-family HTH domain